MTIKHIFKLFFIFLIFSCNNNSDYNRLTRIQGERVDIDENISTDSSIDNFIKPFRENLNKNLDVLLSYAPDTYSKSDGKLNTAIGNLMADAVFEESNPIFNKRTGQNIDLVLLNHGGIRSIISKGNITIRTAFEVMPFENSVVVASIKGKQILEMSEYLSKAKRAHPVSRQLQLTLDKDSKVASITLNGQPIDKNTTYYVATNDYLYNGGDRMTFFHPSDSLYVLDYKIRNVLIDYFKKNDTINPKRDNRFIKLEK